MNIFVLDFDPQKAARYSCNAHVVKMPIETAQILCSVFHLYNFKRKIPYKLTHANHPCSSWARESKENSLWLLEHGFHLCHEYFYRYGFEKKKQHRVLEVMEWIDKNIKYVSFPKTNLTEFVCAMKPEFIISDSPIENYRNYYIKGKPFLFYRYRTPPFFLREEFDFILENGTWKINR
jgi:hypothetical protein